MLLPHYHDVNIMYIPGKDPAMVFLNAKNKVVLEEDVSEKSKEEICQILEKHGMMKSEVARDEVPEEPEDEPEETYEEEGTWDEDQETGDEEEEEEEPEDEEGTEGPGTEEHEDEFDAPDHIEL
ncbi:unnamed protein product [Porites evermanni]|uniref:Selenoprotein F/M domain-containing protein n=1 Tax=Porites evermanni TaxID=104178 RepID=A0ABN8RGN8_9CNID|nr:unnamed protein product [Porites evermanni]